MKAENWIDRVKAEKNLPSDYAVAKTLGLSRFTVSGYRQRPDATLDEEIAVKIANALGINPAGIVLDQVAERVKNPEVRSAIKQQADKLCILCKVTVAAIVGLAKPAAMRPAA